MLAKSMAPERNLISKRKEVQPRMFQWSDKQQPVLRALEMPELVNCYVYHGIFPAWENLSAGVCGCPGKAQEQSTSFRSQEEKIQGFRDALSPS